MAEREVEVAIIGAGTAGARPIAGCGDHTDRLLLIEGGPHGTTCTRVGCMRHVGGPRLTTGQADRIGPEPA